ncbi:unnamed protein product [Vitrella brassicaformis CCMP3155]|uniref:Uncharacterized protein n=1 Tax=Vitrella brassicaformis (strain CCMP3155) TaxID=1169540 RepID=A0A0G4GC45_VITBC|nr:unnamed protein product [Vitrella brassicaformis CCMP3155]|eukprot:CEM26723.1 unnamed protein product [Vitrella brassicaformis CCMP3155]
MPRFVGPCYEVICSPGGDLVPGSFNVLTAGAMFSLTTTEVCNLSSSGVRDLLLCEFTFGRLPSDLQTDTFIERVAADVECLARNCQDCSQLRRDIASVLLSQWKPHPQMSGSGQGYHLQPAADAQTDVRVWVPSANEADVLSKAEEKNINARRIPLDEAGETPPMDYCVCIEMKGTTQSVVSELLKSSYLVAELLNSRYALTNMMKKRTTVFLIRRRHAFGKVSCEEEREETFFEQPCSMPSDSTRAYLTAIRGAYARLKDDRNLTNGPALPAPIPPIPPIDFNSTIHSSDGRPRASWFHSESH